MAVGVQEIKYSSYARLGRRWRRPARGFRLSLTRLSVRGLRAKLWTLLGLMGRCACNVRLLTRGLVVSSTSPTSTSGGGGGKRVLVGGKDGRAGRAEQAARAAGSSSKARRPPCMRSNSFYARAVAECLDFIKGSNAASVEDNRAAAGVSGKATATATASIRC